MVSRRKIVIRNAIETRRDSPSWIEYGRRYNRVERTNRARRTRIQVERMDLKVKDEEEEMTMMVKVVEECCEVLSDDDDRFL